MNVGMVSLELPSSVYEGLRVLAAEDQSDPVEVIARLVKMASARHAWLSDLAALREQIGQDGGLNVGRTKDEVIERLRQTRREVFEVEYAHLYR